MCEIDVTILSVNKQFIKIMTYILVTLTNVNDDSDYRMVSDCPALAALRLRQGCLIRQCCLTWGTFPKSSLVNPVLLKPDSNEPSKTVERSSMLHIYHVHLQLNLPLVKFTIMTNLYSHFSSDKWNWHAIKHFNRRANLYSHFSSDKWNWDAIKHFNRRANMNQILWSSGCDICPWAGRHQVQSWVGLLTCAAFAIFQGISRGGETKQVTQSLWQLVLWFAIQIVQLHSVKKFLK